MHGHLTVEQRRLALRLKARGLSLREIGAQGAPDPGLTSAARNQVDSALPADGRNAA